MNADAAINSIKEVPSKGSEETQEAKVNLASLSEMTGFPVDFIKSELLVQENEMTLSELRASMTTYLEKTNLEIIH
jgi:hypothetical protein